MAILKKNQPLIVLSRRTAEGRLIFSPEWITNGHWAVKRECVLGGQFYNSGFASTLLNAPASTEMTAEQINKIICIDMSFVEKFEMTKIIIVDRYPIRVFVNSKGDTIQFNEEYRKLLRLETVYQANKGNRYLYRNEKGDKVLMVMLKDTERLPSEWAIIPGLLKDLNKEEQNNGTSKHS